MCIRDRLTTEQFWESQILEKYRNQAKAENNHIALYKHCLLYTSPHCVKSADGSKDISGRYQDKKLTHDGYDHTVYSLSLIDISCLSIGDRSSDRFCDSSGDQGTKYSGRNDSYDPSDYSGRNSFWRYPCSGIHFCTSGRYWPSVPES